MNELPDLKETIKLTGADLIKWIQDHHAEDMEVLHFNVGIYHFKARPTIAFFDGEGGKIGQDGYEKDYKNGKPAILI